MIRPVPQTKSLKTSLRPTVLRWFSFIKLLGKHKKTLGYSDRDWLSSHPVPEAQSLVAMEAEYRLFLNSSYWGKMSDWPKIYENKQPEQHFLDQMLTPDISS